MVEQEQIIKNIFSDYETVSIPVNGLTLTKMKELVDKLHYLASGAEVHEIGNKKSVNYPAIPPNNAVVFVSPIPYMLMELSRKSIYCDISGKQELYKVLVFHNDRREKKELPDGRIIQTVAETGWQLV